MRRFSHEANAGRMLTALGRGFQRRRQVFIGGIIQTRQGVAARISLPAAPPSFLPPSLFCSWAGGGFLKHKQSSQKLPSSWGLWNRLPGPVRTKLRRKEARSLVHLQRRVPNPSIIITIFVTPSFVAARLGWFFGCPVFI